MTNLQRGAATLKATTLRRLWLGLPIAIGGGLAALITGLTLLPQLMLTQTELQRLAQLEQKRQQISLLRTQLRSQTIGVERAEMQQQRLFEVVTGNGDLSTFLAMVDREAGLAGVRLEQVEPQSPTPAPSGPKAPGAAPQPPATPPGQGAGGGNAAAAADEMEIRGLERQAILLSARGSYPALLDLLRRLEKLNVLVVQSDLRLQLDAGGPERRPVSPGAGAAQAVPQPLLKVLLSIYSRPRARPTPARQPGAVAAPQAFRPTSPGEAAPSLASLGWDTDPSAPT